MEFESKAERKRTFLREIGGIVLGVLIALALGAMATAVGWQIDAADARRALSLELGEIIGQGQERADADHCIELRLDRIGMVIDAAAESGTLAPLGNIGNPLFRTWSHGVWDSTLSAETASHMDRNTLDNLSGVYEFVTILNRENASEIESWTELFALVGPGRKITLDEIASLRLALSRARKSNRMSVMAAERLHQVADAYDLPYDRNTVAENVQAGLAKSYCAPIGKPTGKGYGQAPFPDILQKVRRNPILKSGD